MPNVPCVRGLSARRSSAHVGRATSNAYPTSRPKKRAGVTPAISNRRPSTASVWPGVSSRPPSSRLQKGSLTTIEGAGHPGRSSAGPSSRPRSGATPTVSKNVPPTQRPLT